MWVLLQDLNANMLRHHHWNSTHILKWWQKFQTRSLRNRISKTKIVCIATNHLSIFWNRVKILKRLYAKIKGVNESLDHNGRLRQEVVVTVLLCSNALGRTAPKVSLWFSAGTEPSLALDDLPPYVLGRQRGVWGGWWGAPQGGWDVTEITREHEASVSLQSRSFWLSD